MEQGTLRSRLSFLLKLSLGAALLAWLLLWNDNWQRVLALFSEIRAIYILPFIAVNFFLIGISCLKWRLFLNEKGIFVPLRRLFNLYLIGTFFNNFLPSNFGGDVARAYYLGREIESQAQSFASVILERLTGLIALVTLALVAYILVPDLRNETLVTLSLALFAGGCLILAAALWHPSLARLTIAPLNHIDVLRRLAAKIDRIHDQIAHFRDKSILMAKALGYSYVFHVGTAVNVLVAALVLGIELNLIKLLAVTPIILIIAALPLTPNSLGVWEWAFSIYLVPAGAETEQGLAVALLLRAMTLLMSIIGGILFLFADGGTRTSHRHL